jgi:tricorn protease
VEVRSMFAMSCRISTRGLFLACMLVIAMTASLPVLAKPGYLSMPDIHGDRVIFTAEGDLWTSTVDGQEVRRLTSHAGDEVFGSFSPDGKWIAFTGDYDGNRDVFVVPSDGGEPKRLTWHPYSDWVVGWTPDGQHIISRSMRHSPHYDLELFKIPFQGGDLEKLPLGRANHISIDAQSGRWAFTRTWGGGTWKRYRGGTAPEIWVGHPDQADFKEVTRFDGIDLYPMWHDGRIYFLSDQGGTGNVWSMLPDGSDRTRHTDHEKWDARGPSMGPDGRIVYGLSGGINLFDPVTGSDRALEIDLPSERTLTRTRYPNTGQYMTEIALSPDGERVAVVARGEIFAIPADEGVTLPITRGSGARERQVIFDPKGKRVLYVTDESGEQAIVTADAWGRGDVKEVKGPDKSGWHFQPEFSPDGKWIAYADMTQSLYIVDAEGGSPIEVGRCEHSEITDYAWSPDGRWLAYAKNNGVFFSSIYIYDVQEKEIHKVTTDSTDDYSPTWDPKGRYLHFLSSRVIDPYIGSVDFETITLKPTRPYMLLLRADVENPFVKTNGIPPEDEEEEEEEDEEKEEDDGEGEDEDKDEDEEEKLEPVEIEFDGLAGRILEVSVDPGMYYGLGATEGRIFYLSFPLRGFGARSFGEEGPSASLMTYDLEEEEEDTFMVGIRGYHLQPKSGKMAVMKGRGEVYVVDAGSPPGDDLSDAQVSMDGVVVELDPREEWQNIYYEGWRFMRDFYWDDSMHGIDWKAVRDQYAELLPLIATRWDLRDLMAEMIGELSTSHTYIWGGDQGRRVPRRSTGLLGAILVRDGEAFRIDRIYRGDPADRVRSPLDEPGVKIKEGEYILAVNNRPFSPDEPFESSLENMAGKEVLLTVNDKAEKDGARHVIVKPMSSQFDLIYSDWVRRNREYVAEKTDGKIGYIHIPDMGGRGMVEFDTWFYPQLDKEGMVVDVRWNGGGFVSQLILARFQRHIISWDRNRWGRVTTYPFRTLNGPFVVLINENAGSDGDIFPAAVKLANLAPVIGKRSWGGVIGIRGFRSLVDGGAITQPESAWWDPTGGWSLEGHGVDPDIEITNFPQDLAEGTDAQLDKGIEEVLRLHRENPPLEPDFGPAPDRSRKAYESELTAK